MAQKYSYEAFGPPVSDPERKVYGSRLSTQNKFLDASIQQIDMMYNQGVQSNKGVVTPELTQAAINALSGLAGSAAFDPSIKNKILTAQNKYVKETTKADYGAPSIYQKNADNQNMKAQLDSIKGEDNFVSPDGAAGLLQMWLKNPDGTPTGYTIGQFKTQFKQYLNPNDNYGPLQSAPNIFTQITRGITDAVGGVVSKFTGQKKTEPAPDSNPVSKPSAIVIPKTSTLAYNNNNPGNLKFVGQIGASKGLGGFAKFADAEAGFRALENQIKIYASKGLSLAEAITKYAPPIENKTGQYIRQIASAIGVSPRTKISDIDTNALAKAIATKESSSTFG